MILENNRYEINNSNEGEKEILLLNIEKLKSLKENEIILRNKTEKMKKEIENNKNILIKNMEEKCKIISELHNDEYDKENIKIEYDKIKKEIIENRLKEEEISKDIKILIKEKEVIMKKINEKNYKLKEYEKEREKIIKEENELNLTFPSSNNNNNIKYIKYDNKYDKSNIDYNNISFELTMELKKLYNEKKNLHKNMKILKENEYSDLRIRINKNKEILKIINNNINILQLNINMIRNKINNSIEIMEESFEYCYNFLSQKFTNLCKEYVYIYI